MIGHLQQLHEQYADKGLVMLGVDFTDPKGVATAFLTSRHVTFPNVVDESPDARSVFGRKYQTLQNAAPCEYIIDRDGKVVKAWYGSGGNEGETLIQSLGIK
jgi:peroxiredoxin